MTAAEGEAATALVAKPPGRFAAGLPAGTITTEVRRDHPEHEIMAAAAAFRAAAVLCARPQTGHTQAALRSVGHVTRFVVDHAPVPVLLVWSSA